MHDGTARVECYYPNEVGGNGPRYYSEDLKPGPEPWWLVGRVRGYASEVRHGSTHVDRWLQVLAAFGAWKQTPVRGTMIDPKGYDPMTAEEARDYANRGWGRWNPVAEYLERQ